MPLHLYHMGAASFHLELEVHRSICAVAVTEEHLFRLARIECSEREYLVARVEAFAKTVRMIFLYRMKHRDDISYDLDALTDLAVEVPQGHGISEVS